METEADLVAEQDVPIGGAIDGDLPRAAVAVLPAGIVTTRELPTLDVTFGTLTIPSGSVQRLGRDPRRRRLLLSVRPHATATAYVVISETEQQARSGYGLTVLQGQSPPGALTYAGELWFAAVGADMQVGFCAEIDS